MLLTCLLAACVPQGPGTSTAPVVINEFVYDDTSTDDKEFVELYNRTNAPVDISGWSLIADDPTTTNPSYQIPANTVLQPGAYYVIGGGTVPNVDLVVGTSNLWENDNESLELIDAASAVVDSVAYEIARGTWGPHPREGAGLLGEIVTTDANPHSWQRRQDGYDSDDNGRDFCVMHWTPGTANGSAQTLQPGYYNLFDGSVGTTLGSDFNYAFVAPNVQDPAAVTNAIISSVPNVIGVPPSPQGGNIGVFHDPTGGGNASYLKIGASEQFMLETFVYVQGGNAAFAAPGATGEAETWAIGVTGTTNGAAHPPDVNGFHAAIQCGGLLPGATGIGWFAYVQQAQTSIYLLDMGHGGSASVLAGPIVATTGVNDGWQRLRLRIDGGNLVANFGGTFGRDDGQRFTASGVGNMGGTVYFQYRECIVSNALMTPLLLDRLEVYGTTDFGIGFTGTGSPTSVGIPNLGSSGGDPVVGNAGFTVTASNLVPNMLGVLLLALGNTVPGYAVPGAPPTVLGYVVPQTQSLLFGDVGGNATVPLPLPPLNALAGLPLALQLVDLDPTLPFVLPIGTSPAMQIVVGN